MIVWISGIIGFQSANVPGVFIAEIALFLSLVEIKRFAPVLPVAGCLAVFYACIRQVLRVVTAAGGVRDVFVTG